MITNRMQGIHSRNEGFNQQTNSTNDQIPHNHSICHNRNRNKHIFLLLIAILIKCFAVTADPTEPPDCSGIVCDLKCPVDSKVIRIDSYDPIILAANASDVPIAETVITPKRKRSILTKQRESIIIVPGDYIRRRRDANDSTLVAQKCCECKCDFSKCPDFKCPPNEYKITVSQATKVPGSCCPKFQCSNQEPTCWSHTLRKHFNVLEHWSEDSCTHCECSETGETNCETSICKPLSCEKKKTVVGECCPVCDISDSKFCEPDIDCDLHCRNGFERDPVRDCAICTCAKSTATTEKTTVVSIASGDIANSTMAAITTTTTTTIPTKTTTTTTIASPAESTVTPSSESDLNSEFIDNTNASSTKPISDDENWPIVLGICITIGAFAIIVSLTCRHLSHKKDKHHLNRKQNTPLI